MYNDVTDVTKFEPLKGCHGPVLLKFNVFVNHLGILLKCDSDSVGLAWGLGFCIYNELPADADATGGGLLFK